MAFIEVDQISKSFQIAKVKSGLGNSIKSLFHREYTVKEAVKSISFGIDQGEVIGYIGPNGAGKSTTIKMMSGVLTPTSGKITVDGLVPYEKRKENAMKIGVVFGQRSQLYWDLPIEDTFEVYQKLYKIDLQKYKYNKEFFIDLLQMDDFMHQPVRQLSLGQKMKANLALSMLHDPRILYLDEPTIGLDVVSKNALRKGIMQINQGKKTTIILTTHDMDDIETTCRRLILIDRGEKLYDGDVAHFKETYQDKYTIVLTFNELPEWVDHPRYQLESVANTAWHVLVDAKVLTKDALTELISLYNPINVGVKDTSIEHIVEQIFTKKTIKQEVCQDA